MEQLERSHTNAGGRERGEGNRLLLLFVFWGGAGDNHYFLQQLERRHTNAGREGKGGGQSIIITFFSRGRGQSIIITFFFVWGGGAGDNHYFLQQLERSHTNAGRQGKGGGQSIIIIFFFFGGGAIDDYYFFGFPQGGVGGR